MFVRNFRADDAGFGVDAAGAATLDGGGADVVAGGEAEAFGSGVRAVV